jgi:hypothetical protein
MHVKECREGGSHYKKRSISLDNEYLIRLVSISGISGEGY